MSSEGEFLLASTRGKLFRLVYEILLFNVYLHSCECSFVELRSVRLHVWPSQTNSCR